VSIVAQRDFPLCGGFFGVIVGVSLLFLFFGTQFGKRMGSINGGFSPLRSMMTGERAPD
jgi:hypothetical protein